MNNLNFNNLPSEIKSQIFSINREAEKDEYYKNNYNDFVTNFNDKVDTEEYYRNDVTYRWMNRYECPDMYNDIMNHTDKKYLLGTSIKQIVYYID